MRRATMLERLGRLLPGERTDGAVFAQTGPRPSVQLAVTLLPVLVGSWISWYLGLAWIGVATVLFSIPRRWVAIACTDRGIAVCCVFRRGIRVIERFDHEAFHGPSASPLEPSVTVGDRTYWLRIGQVDEARRMARAARSSTHA